MRSIVTRTQLALAVALVAGILLGPATAAPVADEAYQQSSQPAAALQQPPAPAAPSAQAPAPGPNGESVRLLVKFRSESGASAALSAVGAVEHRTIADIGVHVVTVPSDRASAAL